MEKRYQVFVSSTYEDLIKERQEVMHALLELDCMPSGMELFPAADEDQWSLIKRVIDDCDYYIVIIGGRYGSVGPDGVSFTQKEYEYAVEQKKPVIAFLHKTPGEIPADKTEPTPEGKKKLEEFRKISQEKMVKYWSNPDELGSVVSRSIIKLMKNKPAIGWVKGDLVPDESSTKEILRLKNRIDELEGRLQTVSLTKPEGTDNLAQGDDEYEIHYQFSTWGDYLIGSKKVDESCKLKWNQIFSTISPLMIDEATEGDLKMAINGLVENMELERVKEMFKDEDYDTFKKFKISESSFNTIKIQLRALGLIVKSSRPRSVKDTTTYWTLTPYGDRIMTRLIAIKKD